MSFIRVTDAATGIKIDINSVHVMSFTAHGEGSKIVLLNNEVYAVSDTPRSIRGYIKKAQGNLASVPDLVEA